VVDPIWFLSLYYATLNSIAAVPPQQVLPSGNRAAAAQDLAAFLNRRAEKTEDVPDGEIDAAVDEAVDHVRHSRG